MTPPPAPSPSVQPGTWRRPYQRPPRGETRPASLCDDRRRPLVSRASYCLRNAGATKIPCRLCTLDERARDMGFCVLSTCVSPDADAPCPRGGATNCRSGRYTAENAADVATAILPWIRFWDSAIKSLDFSDTMPSLSLFLSLLQLLFLALAVTS